MYDIAVIGSGPGGYVAAIKAKQLGFNVVVIEKAELGGICLNWGCIPTKALLKSAMVYKYACHASDYGILINEVDMNFNAVISRSRTVAETMSKGIQFLFKKNHIDVVNGFGKLINPNTIEVVQNDGEITTVKATYIILATGAHSKDLPNIIKDGKKIIGYREAMTLQQKPNSMLVIGSGAIGTEFAYFYNTIGCNVTLVEYMPDILPLEDKEITKLLARELKKSQMKIMTSSSVTSIDTIGNKCIAKIHTSKGEETIETDIVLLAAGVTTNLEGIGLEQLNIKVEKGKVVVDKYYQTSISNIYAIGDIVDGPALAHVASAEAICAVEHIAGIKTESVNYSQIPSCVYCSPELASIGYTEEKAIEAGFNIRTGRFPFTASGKATASGNREGMIKIIINADNEEILGAHFLGDNVTEMIAEIAVAMKKKAKCEEIIKTIHPHPTMSEAIMEATESALGHCIHL